MLDEKIWKKDVRITSMKCETFLSSQFQITWLESSVISSNFLNFEPPLNPIDIWTLSVQKYIKNWDISGSPWDDRDEQVHENDHSNPSKIS